MNKLTFCKPCQAWFGSPHEGRWDAWWVDLYEGLYQLPLHNCSVHIENGAVLLYSPDLPIKSVPLSSCMKCLPIVRNGIRPIGWSVVKNIITPDIMRKYFYDGCSLEYASNIIGIGGLPVEIFSKMESYENLCKIDIIRAGYRLLSQGNQRMFAIDCAEHAIHHTPDPRVYAAIEAARAYVEGKINCDELENAQKEACNVEVDSYYRAIGYGNIDKFLALPNATTAAFGSAATARAAVWASTEDKKISFPIGAAYAEYEAAMWMNLPNEEDSGINLFDIYYNGLNANKSDLIWNTIFCNWTNTLNEVIKTSPYIDTIISRQIDVLRKYIIQEDLNIRKEFSI